MTRPHTLTTEAGAPVADNQHSQTAGPGGAPVDGSSKDGRTALMYAAMFDRLEVLGLLLGRGAAPARADAAGATALTAARMMGAQRTAARLEALALA